MTLRRQVRCLPALASLVLGCLVWPPLAASPLPAAQDPAAIEALLEQSRAEGLRYEQTKDERAKNTVKKALNDAEKLLKKALDQNPECEKCTEQLVLTYSRQAYFGFTKNYDECLELASQSLRRFPANGRFAFYKGLVHYNMGEFGEAIHAVKRYVASASHEPHLDDLASKILLDSQQKFQTNWYKQAGFYQSRESRAERLNPQTFVNEVIFQATPEWEVSTANQLTPALVQQAPAVQDPELQSYLDQLVARLTSRTPGPSYSYRITALNGSAVNAVTMPGQILIYSGMLQFVDNEAELAGVLAHELGHNYGHHAARTVIKQYQAQNLAGAIGRAVNPQGRAAQTVTGLVASVGLDLFLRAYSRFEEKEADIYGAHILYNAGYNPTAMSQMHLKMYQKNPSQPAKFLSTHPPSPDRAEYLTDYLDAFDLGRPLSTDSDAFKKIKAKYPSAAAGLMPRVGGETTR